MCAAMTEETIAGIVILAVLVAAVVRVFAVAPE